MIAVFYHARISGGAHAATDPNDVRVNFPANPPINPGHARTVLNEQIAALYASGLLNNADKFIIGLNGNSADYRYVRSVCGTCDVVCHGPEAASELPTMALLDQFAREHDDAVVFYHHSKGVCWPGPAGAMRQAWRRCLTRNTVFNWRQCVMDLLDGYEMVGAHWLSAEEYPHNAAALPHPIWGGNFFWTTTNYLRRLSPLQSDHSWRERYQAEMWPTSGDPQHIKDYAAHWPGIDACANGS